MLLSTCCFLPAGSSRAAQHLAESRLWDLCQTGELLCPARGMLPESGGDGIPAYRSRAGTGPSWGSDLTCAARITWCALFRWAQEQREMFPGTGGNGMCPRKAPAPCPGERAESVGHHVSTAHCRRLAGCVRRKLHSQMYLHLTGLIL